MNKTLVDEIVLCIINEAEAYALLSHICEMYGSGDYTPNWFYKQLEMAYFPKAFRLYRKFNLSNGDTVVSITTSKELLEIKKELISYYCEESEEKIPPEIKPQLLKLYS